MTIACLQDVGLSAGYPAGTVWADKTVNAGIGTESCMTQQQIQDTFLIKPLWSITAAEGLQLSLAIGLLWGLGFAFRVLGQTMKESTIDSSF